jgi:hypothetical protein
MQETLGGAIIHYINGEKEGVIFLRDDSDEGRIAAVERIQSALQSNLLVMRTTDNRLLAIPVSSILKIEVNPAPPEVPKTVIDNVRIVPADP